MRSLRMTRHATLAICLLLILAVAAYVVPGKDLVVVATTDWTSIGDPATVDALETAVLDVIVNGVVPAAQ